MNTFLTILVSIVTSGFVATIVNYELQRKNTIWELRRKVCEDTLDVAEAAFSNISWEGKDSNDNPINQDTIKKEKISTEKVRHVHNLLITFCRNSKVPNMFKELIFLKNSDATKIVDLRNAIRLELGLKGEIDQDKERAFIARVAGDNEN